MQTHMYLECGEDGSRVEVFRSWNHCLLNGCRWGGRIDAVTCDNIVLSNAATKKLYVSDRRWAETVPEAGTMLACTPRE